MVCVLNDHGIRVRNVQSGLDDGGGHQHIDIAVDEIQHDLL